MYVGAGAGREEGIAKMLDSDTDVVGPEISQISSSTRCCSDSDCKRRLDQRQYRRRELYCSYFSKEKGVITVLP